MRLTYSLARSALTFALVVTCVAGQSPLVLTPLFGDHAVVQRSMPIRVPGRATPGRIVKGFILRPGQNLQSAEVTAEITADKNGRFRLEFPPRAESTTPISITVDAGPDGTRTISDVLVGEVWLAGGQSNMEWTVNASANPELEREALVDPMIRVLKAPHVTAADRRDTFPAEWRVATKEATGEFTAVGAFFAREIKKVLNIPIGILDINWGGTRAEPWADPSILAEHPLYAELIASQRKRLDAFRAESASQGAERQAKAKLAYDVRVSAWWDANEALSPRLTKDALAPVVAMSSWKICEFPSEFSTLDPSLAKFDGTVWARRAVAIPQAMIGHEALLELGPIDDCDRTFINGVAIGQTTTAHDQPRKYRIPAEMMAKPELVLSIEIVDLQGPGGGSRPDAWVLRGGAGGTATVPLIGSWMWKQGPPLKSRPPAMPTEETGPGTHPSEPGAMFHAMILPAAGWPIRGAIWYQGESNAGTEKDATDYATLLPLMVRSWRQSFDCGDFPFGVVSLAGFNPFNQDKACDGIWPLLRESQFNAAASIPRGGIIQTYDVGAANNIHPKDKQTVGKRLAAWALATAYMTRDDRPVVWLGPRVTFARRDGEKVVLKVDSDGPLRAVARAAAKEGTPSGFSAGTTDFNRVTAEFVGQDIVLIGPGLAGAAEIRFAWQDNPEDANVTDAKGLPMVPFRLKIRT